MEKIIKKISYILKSKTRFIPQYYAEYTEKRFWLPAEEISEYRKKIKIYDVFTFFNELDLLEIRFEILDPVVDYFVIVEATETFSGKAKPLYFEENKDRFKKWQHKIIHHVIRDVPKDPNELRQRLEGSPHMSPLDLQIINDALTSDNIAPGAIHWFKEFYQKESIKKALINLNDIDICFVGDVDEIWNPQLIIDYSRDTIYKLRQKVYAYFLNNRTSEPWAGTLMTQYKNIKDACLNHLRTPRKTKYIYLSNGGWHFTNMGGADQIKKKLESYGHQEYNTNMVKADLENKILNNQDFIGRKFKFWKSEKNLPPYILNNKEKYKKYFK
jgi:beta-1,4-mannosyl-glycoprotein beta-1,4-N-acetylglucosaminyltransferase